MSAALAALSEEERARVGARWATTAVSAAAPLLVDLAARGTGIDLAALGLVAGVLWAETSLADVASRQVLARARLEDHFGRDKLDASAARAWSEAAESFWTISARSSYITDAAERELARAGEATLAAYSTVLPSGFDLRLVAFADDLGRGDVEAASGALAWAEAHRLADRRRHRLDAAAAAVGLLRRRRRPPDMPRSSFPAAAEAYAADGAFVDEAVRLLEEGDSLPALAAVYAELSRWAASEQDRVTKGFGDIFVEWSRSEPVPDPRIVPLERVLTDVVAPVAAQAPVLMVVCDGMSLPVAHRLLRDLRNEHWVPAVPGAKGGWPVGVALLPTVTEVSRTSLFTGTRISGGQAEERTGFAEHPALRAAGKADRPPVLYHKAALVGPSGAALPEAVRAQVADPDQRIVGVVVNSVDDHLARGDQIRVDWDLSSLRPLGWLLDAASEAGRVVVLTADHGHVMHQQDAVVRPAGGGGSGGERWRTSPPPAGDGEAVFSGPRVILGGGTVVLPVDDRIRYGGYKYGYHGGATREEVLVPIEVLARRLPEGWRYLPAPEPAWWRGDAAPTAPTASLVEAAPAEIAAPPVGAQGSFFDPEAPAPAVGGRSWVERLLASPAFLANRDRVRLPRPLAEERLRSYLTAIESNGGSMPLAGLSRRTGEPADTLRMALSLVQRLVNLDGEEVLAVRADGLVVLNEQLASLQFGIDGS